MTRTKRIRLYAEGKLHDTLHHPQPGDIVDAKAFTRLHDVPQWRSTVSPVSVSPYGLLVLGLDDWLEWLLVWSMRSNTYGWIQVSAVQKIVERAP